MATLNTLFTDMANAIRSKNGSNATYLPAEMPDAIRAIPTGSAINNQNKTATPTESIQYISADSGYTGLGTVTVNAIPSNYIIPSGTLSITSNGTQDVTNYVSVSVNVSGGGSTINNQDKTINPSESQQTVTADSGYTGLGTVTVNAVSSTYVGSGITRNPQLVTDILNHSITISANPGYYSESQDVEIPAAQFEELTGRYSGRDGYFYFTLPIDTAGYWDIDKSFSLNPSNITDINVRTGDITITPTESSQQVADYGDFIDGTITVDAIPSTYVGSGITQRSSTDLTVSGATVSVPAGYYSAAAQKSIASGSTRAPSSISGTSASITTGTNTLTLTKTVSVTPTVSAGYVSSGTATNSSVSLTASVTTKAAATITPGTSNQTIAAGTYLTGTQTIAGDVDLKGSNILSTANIFGVQGEVELTTVYVSTSAPTSSTGSNGDIYIYRNRG